MSMQQFLVPNQKVVIVGFMISAETGSDNAEELTCEMLSWNFSKGMSLTKFLSNLLDLRESEDKTLKEKLA